MGIALAFARNYICIAAQFCVVVCSLVSSGLASNGGSIIRFIMYSGTSGNDLLVFYFGLATAPIACKADVQYCVSIGKAVRNYYCRREGPPSVDSWG